MMVGFGYCVKEIRGRRYLYFWHYETRDGRRTQVEEYLGPVDSDRARSELVRRTQDSAGRAIREVRRGVETVRAEVARFA